MAYKTILCLNLLPLTGSDLLHLMITMMTAAIANIPTAADAPWIKMNSLYVYSIKTGKERNAGYLLGEYTKWQ